MSTCEARLDPTNTYSNAFYTALKEKGISCEALDAGYRIINYDGKYCSNDGSGSCLRGAGDGVVESLEVIEYVMNRHDTYRGLIEGVLKQPLPWVLDDLDPKTTFDEQIRAKVQEAIDRLNALIKSQGIQDNTDEYKKRLATGLFYLAALPGKELIAKKLERFNDVTRELTTMGLGEFKEYLKQNGGLHPVGSDSHENYSALEAIQKNNSNNNGLPLILFSAFKMAGLEPQFITVPLEGLETLNASETAQLKSLLRQGNAGNQTCIAIKIEGRLRVFDALLYQSDAHHRLVSLISPRQFLALNRVATFPSDMSKTQIDELIHEALWLDPHFSLLYGLRGMRQLDEGKEEEAENDFSRAIEINPHDFKSLRGRASMRLKHGNEELGTSDIMQAVQVMPPWIEGQTYLGNYFIKKEDPVRAIEAFSHVIEEDPKNSDALLNRGMCWFGIGEFEKAEKDMKNVLTLNPGNVMADKILALISLAQGRLADGIDSLALSCKRDPKIKKQILEDTDQFIQSLKAVAYLRWLKNDSLSKLATSFSNETEGLDLVAVETRLLTAYILWKSDEHARARNMLQTIVLALKFKNPPSGETKAFLQTMLQLMPQSMKKDPQVGKMVAAIQKISQ